MATKAKISRKELNAEVKKNLFTDTEYFEMWFAAKWKLIAGISVAAAVVVAAGVGIARNRAENEEKIRQEFAAAETGTELEKVIAKHPGHSGEAMARLRLADIYIAAKQNDKAIAVLTQVLNAPDAFLQAKARLLNAELLENSGKIKEAAALYNQVLNNASSGSSLRAEAGCALARLEAEKGNAKPAADLARRVKQLPGLNEYWQNAAQEILLAAENNEYAPAKK